MDLVDYCVCGRRHLGGLRMDLTREQFDALWGTPEAGRIAQDVKDRYWAVLCERRAGASLAAAGRPWYCKERVRAIEAKYHRLLRIYRTTPVLKIEPLETIPPAHDGR